MKIFKLENSDSKRAYLYLGLLYMVLFIPLILFRYPDLRNEFKYLVIAQDMIESKNYLIMRYFGELYPDKPPIYFWLLIFFKKYFENWTYPLMLLTGGLLPAMFTSMISFKLFSKFFHVQKAFCIALSLALLPFSAGISTVLRMDHLMNLFIIGALYIFYSLYFGVSQPSKIKIYSIYLLIGTGILVKGGAALAVPLVAILFLLGMERNFGYLKKIKIIPGLGIVVAIVSLWLLSLYFQPQGKEYINLLLGQETLGRALKSKTHVRPFYYYAYKLPLLMLPFTPFFIWGFGRLVKKIGNFRDWTPVEKISFTWFLAPFIFFSLLSGKLDIYLLPILAPGVVISLLPLLDDFKMEKILRGILMTLMGFFLVANAGLPYYEGNYGMKPLVKAVNNSEKEKVFAYRFGDSLNLRDEIGQNLHPIISKDELENTEIDNKSIVLIRNKYKSEFLKTGKYIEIYGNKKFSLYRKEEKQ